MTVDILLATYNGERYLEAQIQSIINQRFEDWRLLVSDDGSTDNTCALLEEFERDYPQKIVRIYHDRPSGSAKANFLRLLARSDAPYAMCCDQDDVWLEDKISITLQTMKELEQKHGTALPLLVHADLTVTDETLKVIAPSMMAYQRLRPNITAFNRLLCQNNVTGCTMMVNAALRELLPQEAIKGLIMHDWWMALIASAFGGIGFVNRPSILYRQHLNNSVGAKDASSVRYSIRQLHQREQVQKRMQDTYEQAAAFLSVYRDRLSPRQIQLLEIYSHMGDYPKLVRIVRLLSNGLLKHDVQRIAGQILFT